MSAYCTKALFTIGRVFQKNATRLQPACFLEMSRERHTKHWDPKFKKLRRLKVIKVDLPKFEEEEEEEDLSKDEIRKKMKELGLQPPRPWMERPFYISCTGGIFEPYVPPEGDGKFSAITTTGAKQKLEFLDKKRKSMMAIRKIRNYDEDFETKDFSEQARDIYIKAHESLVLKDKLALRQHVTERAYPELIHNTHDKTIHWKFIESLEPARVVQARYTDVITKDNIFAQVTVRLHTQQVLAIYDRFGRLMHGSEILKKDVLEYVVFEKHLSHEYGVWRLHEKIIPPWMPSKAPGEKTFILDKPTEDVTDVKPDVKLERNDQVQAAQ